MIYVLIIVAVMVIDRIVKSMVSGGMSVGDTFPVIGDFFHITYVQNTGVAFSMMENHPGIISAATGIILLIGLVYLCANYKKTVALFSISLSLIIGGGLGNLTDRVFFGYVIDMFDFGSFPVFNVADIAVCVGCGVLILYMLIYETKNTGDKK